MSNNEKKYGKVITIRLRPENAWIADQIDIDITKKIKGHPIVSGRSEFVELLLLTYYANNREDQRAIKALESKKVTT